MMASRMASIDVSPFASTFCKAPPADDVMTVVAVPGGIMSTVLKAKFWADSIVCDPSALLSNTKVTSAGSQYAMVVVRVVVRVVVGEVVLVLVAVVEVVDEVVALLVALVVALDVEVDVALVVCVEVGLEEPTCRESAVVTSPIPVAR